MTDIGTVPVGKRTGYRGRRGRHRGDESEPVKEPVTAPVNPEQPAEVKFKHVGGQPVILTPIPRRPR